MAKLKEYHGIRAASPEQALVIAAGSSDLKATKALLADGVSPNATADDTSAIHAAADRGQVKQLEVLIAARANLESLNRFEMTPLMAACHSGKTKGSKVALVLIQAGANVNAVRDDEMTPLKFAVDRATPAVLEALLAAGAKVDGPKGTDLTALMLAARANNVESLKVLVKHGANLKLKCGLPWAEGRTAEGLAELERRSKALAYLRRAGK